MVSTLDFESSDPSSSLGGTSFLILFSDRDATAPFLHLLVIVTNINLFLRIKRLPSLERTIKLHEQKNTQTTILENTLIIKI